MLQGNTQPFTFISLCCFLTFSILISCKPEPSTNTAERDAYFHDYQPAIMHWGFIDSLGSIKVAPLYEDVGPFSEGLAAVNVDGLWGYIDTTGSPVIQPQFRSAYTFHNRRARVKAFDEPDFYIDPKGKMISDPSWTAAGDFADGLAKVKSGQVFGYIDTTGNMVIKPIFTRAWNFQFGYALVENLGKIGLINQQGNYIINPVYDQLRVSSDTNLVLANQGTNAFILDISGSAIVRFNNSKAMETDGKMVSLYRDQAYWLYDISTKKNINEKGFKQLVYLDEKRWGARLDSLYVLVNESGEEISSLQFSQINKFREGKAAFMKGKSWGYIDRQGKIIMEPTLGLAWDYKNGFARAAFKEGIAFMNHEQKIVFHPPAGTFDLRDFSEGLAPFQMNK